MGVGLRNSIRDGEWGAADLGRGGDSSGLEMPRGVIGGYVFWFNSMYVSIRNGKFVSRLLKCITSMNGMNNMVCEVS